MAKDLRPCGTRAAYKRHLRNGEPACAECLEAENRGTAEHGGYRAAVQSIPRRAIRNGLPEFRPYRYGGTGADVLTGHLSDAELELSNA